MLPPFDQHGYLPAGIHLATLDEIKSRFGQGSELRRSQIESIGWLVPISKRAGIARLILNGSFVTDRSEPNDVDCLLLQGPNYDPGSPPGIELRQGLPFLEIKVVKQEDFDLFASTIFGTDRNMIPKGVVEVIL